MNHLVIVATIVATLACIALGIALYWCDEWCTRCKLAREERDCFAPGTVELLRRGLDLYGQERELRKLQEECCELGAAVAHLLEGREGASLELAEELADVLIVASQIRLLLVRGPVDSAIARKLSRFKSRLDKDEGVVRLVDD